MNVLYNMLTACLRLSVASDDDDSLCKVSSAGR